MKLTCTIVTVLLMLCFLPEISFSQAAYDTVSIHDLQWVPNPDSSQVSLYDGDTVVVGGFVQPVILLMELRIPGQDFSLSRTTALR